ncbi:MAG TPA: hypothetical protein VIY48_05345 [Candidatus Paceibacterota bacterium]
MQENRVLLMNVGRDIAARLTQDEADALLQWLRDNTAFCRDNHIDNAMLLIHVSDKQSIN